MERIPQILENLLHVSVQEQKPEALPQFLRGMFDVSAYMVEGVTVLFACPKTGMTFATLQKQWGQLCKNTHSQCVLYLQDASRYAKERLIGLGVPFIQGEDNLYLPFLGVALRKRRSGALPNITKLTPVAQKMILLALYENWREVSSREISVRMGVSRMTASRNLLELQSLGLPLVREKKGAKYFSFSGSRMELFELCSRYLCNPVSKTYILEEIPHGVDCLGGRSALSRWSMLPDRSYRTYAVTREECAQLHIAQEQPCGLNEAACIVQVVRYKIKEQKTIDPISAVLCVLENEKCTPREEAAMKKMLQEVLR